MKKEKLKALLAGLALFGVAALGVSGAEPRKFLLLVDYLHNDLPGVTQSRDAALHFLATQVREEDEVALLVFTDVRGFRVLAELTPDHDLVRKKLSRMVDVPGRSGFGGSVVPAIVEIDAKTGQPITVPAITTGVGSPFLGQRDYVFLSSMRGLAEGLAEVEGPKSIVYFSSGFPAWRYEADRTFRERFDEMASAFGAAGAQVFVINAMGSRANMLRLAEKPDFVLRKFASLAGGKYFDSVADYKKIAEEIGRAAGL